MFCWSGARVPGILSNPTSPGICSANGEGSHLKAELCLCIYGKLFFSFLVIFNFSGVFLISNSQTSLDNEL